MKLLVIGNETMRRFAEEWHAEYSPDLPTKIENIDVVVIQNMWLVVWKPLHIETDALIVLYMIEPKSPCITNPLWGVFAGFPDAVAFFHTFYPNQFPEWIEVTHPLCLREPPLMPVSRDNQCHWIEEPLRPVNNVHYLYDQYSQERLEMVKKGIPGLKILVDKGLDSDAYFRKLSTIKYAFCPINSWGYLSCRVFDALQFGAIPLIKWTDPRVPAMFKTLGLPTTFTAENLAKYAAKTSFSYVSFKLHQQIKHLFELQIEYGKNKSIPARVCA